MGLTTSEVIELSGDAFALITEIRDALKPDATGRKRITRKEGKRIFRLALALLGNLATDIVD